MQRLRIVSGNLCDHPLRRDERASQFIDLVRQLKPDMIFCQEATPGLEQDLGEYDTLFTYAYPTDESGLLFASRFPIIGHQVVRFSRRANVTQVCSVAYQDHEVATANLHRPTGFWREAERTRESRCLAEFLKAQDFSILAGDTNSACNLRSRRSLQASGFMPVSDIHKQWTYPSEWGEIASTKVLSKVERLALRGLKMLPWGIRTYKRDGIMPGVCVDEVLTRGFNIDHVELFDSTVSDHRIIYTSLTRAL